MFVCLLYFVYLLLFQTKCDFIGRFPAFFGAFYSCSIDCLYYSRFSTSAISLFDPTLRLDGIEDAFFTYEFVNMDKIFLFEFSIYFGRVGDGKYLFSVYMPWICLSTYLTGL